MRWILTFAVIFAGVLQAPAAELAVLVDGPARPAIRHVAGEFESRTGHSLTFVFAPGPVLNKRVMAGERADVLISPKRYVEELDAASKAALASAKSIGGAGFSLAVRKGGAIFDISTAEGLKVALLQADAVVVNTVGSGNYFATVVDRLGLSQSIANKIVRVTPDAVFDRVAQSSTVDLAVGTTPLILEDSRLQTLGELPQDFQSRLELFAVPLGGANDRAAAEAFIAFLTDPEIKKRLAAAGLK